MVHLVCAAPPIHPHTHSVSHTPDPGVSLLTLRRTFVHIWKHVACSYHTHSPEWLAMHHTNTEGLFRHAAHSFESCMCVHVDTDAS